MAAVAGQAKPAPMTTERIQEMLEENFKFIKAIAEQQNLGRVQDVNQFQQKLQENLMLLAAVADTYASTAAAGTTGQAAAPPGAVGHAARPAAAPISTAGVAAPALPGQLPIGGLQAQQPQQQAAQANPLMMVMPGNTANQVGAQPAATMQLAQQQIQAAVQQALVRQQQQQPNPFQPQQSGQQFQLPQTLQQQPQQQVLNAMGALGGQTAGGGFQLPAPPPLNLGM